MRRALADTSYFVAEERAVNKAGPILDELAVSVITIGELRAGVLAAKDPMTTARRLHTLRAAEMLDPLPVEERTADAWSELRVLLQRDGRRLDINDSWIAATAIANGLPVLTRDSDFEGVPGLAVITL